jgi:hypothetical protein
MAWPTREWWRKAFAGIDARVREQFRRDVLVQDRARSEREQADERARIASVLRGRAAMTDAILREGWYQGGGRGGFRRVDGGTSTRIYWED